jgi:hypothetical protein
LKSGSDALGRWSSKTPSLRRTLTTRRREGRSTCVRGWKLAEDPGR